MIRQTMNHIYLDLKPFEIDKLGNKCFSSFLVPNALAPFQIPSAFTHLS